MPPPIILMGHSMGGAVAVHVAHSAQLPTVVGLVVIDVVEGTALGALASMQSFLRGRPQSFLSIEDAIRWRYKLTLFHLFRKCTSCIWKKYHCILTLLDLEGRLTCCCLLMVEDLFTVKTELY